MTSAIDRHALQALIVSNKQTLHAVIYAWGAKEIAPGWVLDLGSEFGFGSAIIAEANFQLKVVSVDMDFSALQYSRHFHQSEYLTHVNSSAVELPVLDSSFSGIFLVNLLHLVDQPFAALSEAARALMPGGLAVISIPQEIYFPSGKGRRDFLVELEKAVSSEFADVHYPAEIPGSVLSLKKRAFSTNRKNGIWLALCRKGYQVEKDHTSR